MGQYQTHVPKIYITQAFLAKFEVSNECTVACVNATSALSVEWCYNCGFPTVLEFRTKLIEILNFVKVEN